MDKSSKANERAGRPPKLTPAIQALICEALSAGNTRTAAAAHAGIGRATFAEWMRRGLDPQFTRRNKLRADCKEFVDFVDAVTRAETEAEIGFTSVLKKAAHGWPVKKTTTKEVEKIIGKTELPNPKAGADGEPDVLICPVYATETTTTTLEYNEYDWRAALEWLQRRNPKQWGLRLRIEQMVEDELVEALDKLQAGLDPEAYTTVLSLLSGER